MNSKVKQARHKKEWSVTDLARESGVSRATIAQLEKGGQTSPTAETQIKIAAALGCEREDLFGDVLDGSQRWPFRTRMIHLRNCEKLVQAVGDEVKALTEAQDKKNEDHGHQSSSVDEFASNTMTFQLNRIYNLSHLKDWNMWLQYEDVVAFASADGASATVEDAAFAPVAVIDEIDGTTNTKRACAGHLPFELPKSAVTIAVKHDRMSDIFEVGAIYAMDTRQVFSGIWSEGEYAAYCDGKLIEVGSCDMPKGDSKMRIIVPCYSNVHYEHSAEIMTAIDSGLAGSHDAKQSECYGGCRSSTMDIIDILRNLYDAYVDIRADWTLESELRTNSVLRLYDIAAVVPIAQGAGLKVAFSDGRDFSLTGLETDGPVAVVIGRPIIVDEILESIRPIVSRFKERRDKAVDNPNRGLKNVIEGVRHLKETTGHQRSPE